MLSAREAWEATLGQLQVQLARSSFDTWLRGAELVAYEDGEFVIRVRNGYAKDWIEKHLDPVITQTLSKIFKRTVRLSYVVSLPTRKPAPTGQAAAGPLWAAAQPQAQTQPQTADVTISKANAAPQAPTARPPEQVAKPEAPKTSPSADKSPANGKTNGAAGSDAGDASPAQATSSLPALSISDDEDLDYSEWDPRFNNIQFGTTTEDDTPLDAHYTFEAFVTGPCNAFAAAAAQAVTEAPGETYNPLCLYSGVGLGKTHLLQAVGHACRKAGKRVRYVTAEAFTNELVAAIRTRKTEAFRERYRHVDVLLIDDIHFIAGKASTEEELYHTFNAITSRQGQIVVSSSKHPRALTKLDVRLRTRFEGGLLADIQPPGYDTRLAILHAKARAQKHELPADVAEALARHQTSTVRELEGLLTQVLARATLTRQPLTRDLVGKVLGQHTHQPSAAAAPPKKSRLSDILETTATYHQLSLDDLVSRKRTKDVVRARHIAIYLAREETNATLPEIGKLLGGRKHSTILHGYKKIAGAFADDDALRREVGNIRRQLQLFPNN